MGLSIAIAIEFNIAVLRCLTKSNMLERQRNPERPARGAELKTAVKLSERSEGREAEGFEGVVRRRNLFKWEAL